MPLPIKNTLFITLVVSALLSACAPQHMRPTEGPTAQLRLISEYGKLMTASSYASTECITGPGYGLMATFGAWGMSPSSRRIGMPGATELPYQYVKENYIAAGKPFVFSFNMDESYTYAYGTKVVHVGGERCDIGFTFNPSPGSMYEARFLIEDSECTATMTRLVQDNDMTISHVPEPSFKKLENACK